MLLSSFAFRAVEAERSARLADRTRGLTEKGQGLVREVDDDLRETVERLRLTLGALDTRGDLARDVAPLVSRVVGRSPFVERFFLLDPEGQRVYPALTRPPTLRRWPTQAGAALGGAAGALLWRSPERLLATLAGDDREQSVRKLSRLAHEAQSPPVRAAALWDLAESYQARQDRPGIFGALEAYRELASLPLGLIDARGRTSAADGRLRLALVHRLLRDRAAYMEGLRQLLADLERRGFELPAASVEELAESVGAHMEYEGLGDEVAERIATLVARRRLAESRWSAIESQQARALLDLLRAQAPGEPPLLVGQPGEEVVASFAFLPATERGRPLVALCLDRARIERHLRDTIDRVPLCEVVTLDPGAALVATPDIQQIQLRPPLAHLALSVSAPPDNPSGVEDALNLPRDTVYLWAIVLSILGITAGVAVTTRTVRREAKAAQLKSDWVANVTHELKTPLTSIQMFLETLQLGRVQDEAEAQECLDVMARESERLSRLIEQLLVFSRLDSRKPRLKLAFVRPEALVDEAISLLADQLNQTDPAALGIEVVSVQNLPQISVDRFGIVQAILNLLQNAWKYAAGPDRKIRVVITARRRFVEIAVEDNGIGVPRRDRRRIFVKFERASNAEKGQIQGSGIGLTLANQIVKAHWGKITYTALKPNGSRFSVLLPK